jgi:hypothetical protein
MILCASVADVFPAWFSWVNSWVCVVLMIVLVSLMAGDCLADNSLLQLSTFNSRVISRHYLLLTGSHWPPTTAKAPGERNSLCSFKLDRIGQIASNISCIVLVFFLCRGDFLIEQWLFSSVIMSQYVSLGKLVKSNLLSFSQPLGTQSDIFPLIELDFD